MQHQDSGELHTTWQFLLYCLRSAWDPAALEPARSLADDHVDWIQLAALVQGQRVGPLLFRTLQNERLLPPDLENQLRQEYLRNAMRNTLLLQELGLVLAKLKTAGIDAIPLKGAALALETYVSPAVRPMADLDILILPAALPAAHEILASLDYTVMDIEPWPYFYKRYRQVSEFNRRSKDGFTFLVDLHWGIVDIPFYKRIPIEGWFNRAKLARCGQAVLKVPAPEDQLLCLCSQWGLHERYAFSLMRFCDVSLLLKRASDSMDWARLIRQNIDWRLLIPVQRALNQVEELWPDTVPAPVLKEITASPPTNGERRIHRWVIDRPQNATSDVLLLLATTPGPENKVRFLLEQAFPSPDYMRARYNPKSSRLWPLLYLWRFFLGLLYLFRSS